MTDTIKTPEEFYQLTGLYEKRYSEVYCRYDFVRTELDRIFDLSTGRATPLSRYITDKSGNVSERKIQMLVNRIMECYENEYVKRSDALKKSHRDCKEFYNCFLYCTIRGFTAYIPLEFYETQTFGDIIRMAKSTDTTVKDMLDLEFSFKSSAYPQCRGFFGVMCYAYKLLTGNNIADEFTGEQRAIISDTIEEYEYYIQQSSDWEEEFRTRDDGTFMTDEEFEEALNADVQIDEIPYSPEDLKLIEKEDELKKAAAEAQDKWLSGLTERDKFIRCYKRARELFFKYGESLEISSDITKMIDCFLCVNGLSDLCGRDRALDTIYHIRNARETIENSRRKRGI